jgi:hypothetical protein
MRYQDLKIGMRVKIVKKVESYHTDADGIRWDNDWGSEMDRCVGKSFEVDSFSYGGAFNDNIDEEISWYSWPWVSLEEVVEPPNESSPE